MPIHLLSASPRKHGQIELLHIFPVLIVPGVGEVLRAYIRIQAIGQGLADRLHMTAGAARCLQQRDLVPALHQFIGATQTADAATDHDDLFAVRGRRCGELPGGAGKEKTTGRLQHLTTSVLT